MLGLIKSSHSLNYAQVFAGKLIIRGSAVFWCLPVFLLDELGMTDDMLSELLPASCRGTNRLYRWRSISCV